MKRLCMRLSLASTLVLASVVQPVGAQSAVPDPTVNTQSGEQRVLEQLRLGERLFRDDIIEDAVMRLYRIKVDHPEGLLAELRMAIRLEQMDKAHGLLDRLDRVAAETEIYRTGALLLELASTDANAELVRARLYATVGRVDDALEIYDRLLGGIYPTVDLNAEYWQLAGRWSERRPEAVRQLQKGLNTDPQHAASLMALATLLFQEDRPDEARAYLRELAQQDLHRQSAASREYEYLTTLPIVGETRDLWHDFMTTYADLNVGEQGRQQWAQQDALLNDPAWQGGQRGVAMVESGEGSTALPLLKLAVEAYPDDTEFLGALGVAYMRSKNRPRALHYFELARQSEPRIDRTYRWVTLLRSTEYWLLLERASEAAGKNDWQRAQAYYRQAHPLQPDDPFAIVGLGDAAMALGQDETAWRYYRQALNVAPAEGSAQRGIARYLTAQSPQRALTLLDQLPAHQARGLADVRREQTLRGLSQQAETAMGEQRWQDASLAFQQAQELAPDDPWISYSLARSLREQGLTDEGLQAYQVHLDRQYGSPESHYAHGLLLASAEQWQAARDTLDVVPRSSWDAGMHDLELRVIDTQQIEQATAYYDAGRKDAAIALLEQRPDSVSARMQVASWSLNDGDYPKALANYNAVLRVDEAHVGARLGLWETWLAQGKTEAVHYALNHSDIDFHAESVNTHRRVAELWKEVGDQAQARQILQQRVADVSEPEPLLFRDLARLTQKEDPGQALDLYARAMQDADLLPADAVQPQRDNVAFTHAMRIQDTDGWLERGVRREAQDLYERRNPTLTINNDYRWRNDGTQGMGRLDANTTMVQLDHPVRHGKGFVRVDHVRMNAGTLKADADGIYRGDFGSCSFSASSAPSGWTPSSDCRSDLKQRAVGTSIAVGWQGDRLSFDLGTTPLGFEVQNWTGGISYTGKWGLTGWRLTASRRPMSNSVLSFAGAKDPGTGRVWGGVMATGGALSLSWDQGEANGVWADISHHRLTGKNVEDNHRTRLMGGYYRRLINKHNEQMTVGVNMMYWRYNKNLGDYTFGQGGYYSPRRYTSVSLPVRYSKRTADWSFSVEGSVSRSHARSGNSAGDSRGGGTGYRVAGYVERRLNNHWVAGGALDWQHSKDYSPNRFMLYLRYSFEPWQGDLPLAPEPITPYADFK